MSIRHYNHLMEQVQGTQEHFMPVAQILALPDRLQFCNMDYNPCDFATPTGAPRMLGPDIPVVVNAEYTYVYMRLQMGDGDILSTYTKLREPAEWVWKP